MSKSLLEKMEEAIRRPVPYEDCGLSLGKQTFLTANGGVRPFPHPVRKRTRITWRILSREAVEDCAPPGSAARRLFDLGIHRKGRSAGPWHLCDSRPVPAETRIG